MGKMTDKDREREDNEQGRGPSRDLPEASVEPDVSEDDPEVSAEDEKPGENAGVGERTVAPVQAPHWNALVDIKRVIPCQVQPVNSKDWYTIKGVKVEDGETVLITSDDKELRARDIGDPVLVRTNDPDANLLH